MGCPQERNVYIILIHIAQQVLILQEHLAETKYNT